MAEACGLRPVVWRPGEDAIRRWWDGDNPPRDPVADGLAACWVLSAAMNGHLEE